jgi:flagellar biosynthesis/type III secretory pathway chaperone
MDKQEIQLREIVKESLENITEAGSPFFYNLVYNQQAYAKAEEMIINYCIANSVPISSAIALIESEME